MTPKLTDNRNDRMAFNGDKPDVTYLANEFRKCAPVTGRDGLRKADEIRFCRWEGQTEDGRKWDREGKPAFPWNGSSDTRPMMVDAVVTERAAYLTTSFWRAMVRPKSSMTEGGQYAVNLVDHLLNTKLVEELTAEVERAAQYVEHYGWVVLHPQWEQRLGMKRQCVHIDELDAVGKQLAAKTPDQQAMVLLQDLANAVRNPDLIDLLVPVMQWVYAQYVLNQIGEEVPVEIPPLRERTIRNAIRKLRLEGEAELVVPYLAVNCPKISALRPYDEVFMPRDTTDVQDARVIFQREWLTEADIRSRIREQGYSETWVEEACKRKGYSASYWGLPEAAGGNRLTSMNVNTDPSMLPVWHNFIEIIHCFRRVVDEDGVPSVWMTTIHPGLTTLSNNAPAYAKNEMLNYPHGEYPFVGGAREYWCRCFTSSRGVPEIAATWQNELKALRDATIDRTSITVMPPVNVYQNPLQTAYKFGPAVRNTVLPGKEPKFMDMPSGEGINEAAMAMQEVQTRSDNYFAILSDKVPPQRIQVAQEMAVRKFLVCWSKAFQQVVELAREWMADGEFATITGAPAGWLDQHRDRMGLLSVELTFDVRELDPQLVAEHLGLMEKVVATDATGIIDRAKLTEIQVRAINPAWARELIQSRDTASKRMYEQVRNDIAQMFLGNEPQYVENDPAAGQKLQWAQQVVQANPNYAAALQQGGRFTQLMEKWVKNLMFSTQQQQNKQVGRIGVTADRMQLAQ